MASDQQKLILGNYEFVNDDDSDVLKIEHAPTGDRVTIDLGSITGLETNLDLGDATRLPRSEPDTPASGECVTWFDSTADALKVKFDDGESATIAEK